MTLERTQAPVTLASQPGIKAKEGEALSRALARDFVALLDSLTPEEWATVTACDPWTVKDVAAHLLGWAEALCSPREMARQARAGLVRRRSFENLLDATNDAQVEAGRSLSTQEIVDRLRTSLPRAAKLRRRLGGPLHYVPAYAGFLGGPFNVGYLLNAIFPRDLIVHAIDLGDATGRKVEIGPAGARVAADMLRDWARRQDVDATIELTAPDAVYVAGNGSRTTISTSTAAIVHRLAGRKPSEDITMTGDAMAGERWLAAGCPV